MSDWVLIAMIISPIVSAVSGLGTGWLRNRAEGRTSQGSVAPSQAATLWDEQRKYREALVADNEKLRLRIRDLETECMKLYDELRQHKGEEYDGPHLGTAHPSP